MIELNGIAFYSKKDVCQRLNMNEHTLNNKVSKHKIHGTRIGRYVYYTELDMLNIIDPAGALYRAIEEAAETSETAEAPAPEKKPEGQTAQPKKKPRKKTRAKKDKPLLTANDWAKDIAEAWEEPEEWEEPDTWEEPEEWGAD